MNLTSKNVNFTAFSSINLAQSVLNLKTGIDLGTTYACIAKVKDDGTVEAIRNQTDQKDDIGFSDFLRL